MEEFAGATYTPFSEDGLSVDHEAVRGYCRWLTSKGLHVAFVNGTSGESMSLSEDERKALVETWVDEGKKMKPRMRIIAHVGCDSLTATMNMAKHAEEVGADAISAMTPIMFKPHTPRDLAVWIKTVCSAAPKTPFYFYHFPVITGLALPAIGILKAIEEVGVPTFRGFKFTDFSLFAYEQCKSRSGGIYDVCYGRDEAALGGMATGAMGHIGNGFCNMIGPFFRMRAAFRAGDMDAARLEQRRVNEVVGMIFDPSLGTPVAVSKAIQSLRGVEMGPVRAPNSPLSADAIEVIKRRLTSIGFFEWCD